MSFNFNEDFANYQKKIDQYQSQVNSYKKQLQAFRDKPKETIAQIAPEVMGVGYDTVSSAMLGSLAVTTLLLIVALKILTSAAAVGLGLPVGLIGPVLVVGAALGGALGYLGQHLQPDAGVSVALYVMLGMAAMMAAVLQAPLAALMAVLELTANPSLMLPAMLKHRSDPSDRP